MTHPEIIRRLERAIVDGEALSADVLGHVRGCAECGAAWDRLCATERAFEGTDGLSTRALASLEKRVLSTVQPARARWWSASRWMAWVPAAAVAVVLVLAFLRPLSTDGFSARGGDDGTSPRAWVRVLCVGPSGVTAEARSSDGNAQLSCGLHDVLAFSVHEVADAPWHAIFVVGVAPNGEPRWYRPHPSDERSVLLPAPPLTDHALGATRLDVNHAPGITRIHVLFTARPLSIDEVRAALTRGELADALPADSIVQSVELHIP